MPLDIACTKYISYWPPNFKVKYFLSFSHYKSVETLYPQGRASLDPMKLIGRVYVGDHCYIPNI